MKKIKKAIIAFAALSAVCTVAFNSAENSGAPIKVESKPIPNGRSGRNAGIISESIPKKFPFRSNLIPR